MTTIYVNASYPIREGIENSAQVLDCGATVPDRPNARRMEVLFQGPSRRRAPRAGETVAIYWEHGTPYAMAPEVGA
jgi:hypothetical protein